MIYFAFLQDDYRVCSENGLITKEMPSICPVDSCGKFTEEVTHFKGMYVKVSNKEKKKKNELLSN